MTDRSQRAAGFLLLASLAGVLLLAFAPIASSLERLSLKLYTFFGVHHAIAPPWVTPEDYSRLLNVAFFVPVGLTLAWWLGARWGWAMPIAVLLSLAIEVLQRVPEVGRDSTLDDVACNVIGASLGVVVVAVLRSATARSTRHPESRFSAAAVRRDRNRSSLNRSPCRTMASASQTVARPLSTASEMSSAAARAKKSPLSPSATVSR